MPKIRVIVTLKPSLLDAQGKVVLSALHQLGYENVASARIGKVVDLDIPDGADTEAAVREMCERLLSNPVIEQYEIEVRA